MAQSEGVVPQPEMSELLTHGSVVILDSVQAPFGGFRHVQGIVAQRMWVRHC